MVGLVLLMIRSNSGFARFDVRLAEFGARHANEAATTLMRTVSLLGGTAGIIGAALVVAAVEARRARSRSVFAFLATVVGGQFLVANLVKWSVDRARPTIDQLTGFAGTSFPSGHAAAAAATYAAFALLLGRGRSDDVSRRARRDRRSDRGRGGIDAGLPWRALVHRCDRRARGRMDVVHDLLDHVRRSLAALRRAGGSGRTGGRRRADPAAVSGASGRVDAPAGSYGSRPMSRRAADTNMSDAAALLVGPLLRYADETSATVWVETDRACTVEIVIGDDVSRAPTWSVHGHHYALVCVDGWRQGARTSTR